MSPETYFFLYSIIKSSENIQLNLMFDCPSPLNNTVLSGKLKIEIIELILLFFLILHETKFLLVLG